MDAPPEWGRGVQFISLKEQQQQLQFTSTIISGFNFGGNSKPTKKYETKKCPGTSQKQLERKVDYFLVNIYHTQRDCRWLLESAESKGINRPKQETV